ncbi:MAG: type II secretion system F family protein [Thermoanaerobacteraceae bacterium]|nr:type II secretion system F family protein [Thermoanaerobacteraceae bacterium]
MIYKVAVHASGTQRNIVVDAGSPGEAALQVKKRLGDNMAVIIKVTQVKQSSFKGLKLFGRVGPRDLAILCKNITVLIQAGVTALEAIETVSSHIGKKAIADALNSVAENVKEGFSLSSAFRGSPDVFPELFCQVLEASEEAGALEEGLNALSSHYEREANFKEKIRQAMSYPSFVAGFAVVISLALFIFVIPKFAMLLNSANVPLPLPTRLMLYFSSHAWQTLLILAISIFIIVRVIKMLWKAHATRLKMELILSKVPYVGTLYTRTAQSRVCTMFALLLNVGIPVVTTLETVEKSCSIISLQDELKVVRSVVRNGGSLSNALSMCKWLPKVVGRMASIGERSGALPEMFENTASLFDNEVDNIIQKLPTLVESAMIICVGALVLFVLLSLFLPIFSMYQTIK